MDIGVTGMPGIFLTAFIVGFSGAMMPGPMLTVTINEGLRRGAKAGLLIALGHAILELILVLSLIMGLSIFVKTPIAKAVIGIGGGGFLLWMGFDMVKNAMKGRISLNLQGTDTGDNRFGPLKTGILVSISNPYWSLWWATVGLGYLVIAQRFGYMGVAMFFIGHILADIVWFTAISSAVAGGRRYINNRVYRVIIVGCGVFLVWLAGSFLVDGFKILIWGI